MIVPWLDFPEGAELYRWVQAPPKWLSYEFPVMRSPSVSFASYDPGTLPDRTHGPESVRIEPMRGPWGWNEDERVGVAFFGHGLPVFDDSSVSDAEVGKLTREGQEILTREAWARLLDKLGGCDE